MKYQIKKRFTNEIIVEGEAESFVKFVEQNNANLSGANLSEANLYNATFTTQPLQRQPFLRQPLQSQNKNHSKG